MSRPDADVRHASLFFEAAQIRRRAGAMTIIIIRRKQSGEAVKYTVADSWLPKLAE